MNHFTSPTLERMTTPDNYYRKPREYILDLKYAVASAEDGTAAAPSTTFALDTDTGFYRKSANTIGVSCGGAEVANFSSTGSSRLANTINFGATTATETLTTTQSGSIGFLPQCTVAKTINLPAPTAGWHFKVILTGVPDGSHAVTFHATGTVMSGVRYGIVAAPVGVSATGVTNLVLGVTAANAKVGDTAEFFSDGTNIYYRSWTNGTADGFSTS